jgi:predicted kinase
MVFLELSTPTLKGNIMLTLTLYRGYPHAGKRTRAMAEIERTGGVCIERDEIRNMLFGKYWGLKRKQEETVTLAQYALIRAAIGHGSNVHISDTNLNMDTIMGFVKLGQELGVQVRIVDLYTTALECVKRNFARLEEGKRGVPTKAIWDMAKRYPMPWPVIDVEQLVEAG